MRPAPFSASQSRFASILEGTPDSIQRSTFSMKKVMTYFCKLDDGWSNKRLIRPLALLLALLIAAPVLVRGDDDRGRDHGRFIDPIVGSWIIHIHVATITPSGPLPPDFDNITAFWEDGNTTSSDPIQGTAYGVWKKVGPRTYVTKIVQVNADGTLATIRSTGELIGDKITGSFLGIVTDSTGKTVLAQFTGTVVDDRITFQSTP
jgi:hypothetical protein